MNEGRFLVALYCDDVRAEVGNKPRHTGGGTGAWKRFPTAAPTVGGIPSLVLLE